MRRFLVVVAGAVAGGGVARAEGNPEALRLFEEARVLSEQARFPEACALFAQSYELERAAGTMLNLGDCAEREGAFRRAWQLYEAAALEYDKSAKAAAAKFARDRAAALHRKLATVIVRIAEPDVPGLTVKIGDRAVPVTAEITDRVELGPLVITVEAPGRAAFQAKADAIGGTQLVIAVPPMPLVAEAPRLRDGDRRRSRVLVAVGLAGVGAIGLGLSGVFALSARRAYDEPFDAKLCVNPDAPMCDDRGKAQIERAGRIADRATYAVIGGAVLLAAGAVVYLTAPRERLRVQPIASPSAVGFAVGGSF